MKSLSQLLRNKNVNFYRYRKKLGNINYQKRKILRRIKMFNTFTKQFTGQQIKNPWLTSKRLKAIGKHIQSMRNNHMGSNPVPQNLKKQLLQVMPAYSDYQYYLFRNRYLQIKESEKALEESNLEQAVKMMPERLRKQFKALKSDQLPEQLHPIQKYIQQLQVYLPQDQKYRYNLLYITQKVLTQKQKS